MRRNLDLRYHRNDLKVIWQIRQVLTVSHQFLLYQPSIQNSTIGCKECVNISPNLTSGRINAALISNKRLGHASGAWRKTAPSKSEASPTGNGSAHGGGKDANWIAANPMSREGATTETEQPPIALSSSKSVRFTIFGIEAFRFASLKGELLLC